MSAFAAPFTWRERSVGTYSRTLAEVPFLEGEPRFREDTDTPVVSVEAIVRVPTILPRLSPNLPDVVQDIRRSSDGLRLRRSMRRLGLDPAFDDQIESWRGVADELATRLTPKQKINISNIVASIGENVVTGALVEGLWPDKIETFPSGLLDRGHALKAVTASALGIATRVLHELSAHYRAHQEVRAAMERSVNFRCTHIPIPPFMKGYVPPERANDEEQMTDPSPA